MSSDHSETTDLIHVLTDLSRSMHWSITRAGNPSADLLRDRRGQVRTLHMLASGAELTMQELAQRLQVSPPTVTGLIRSLLEKEYVSRNADEHDWRVVRVSITEQGLQALRAHREEVHALVASMLDELDQEQILTLREALPALQKLIHVLHESREKARAGSA